MHARHRRWIAVPVIAGAFLLPGCDGAKDHPGLLEPDAPAGSEISRPFSLELVGNAAPDFSQGPCDVVNIESGTGIALHMGEVTWSSRELVDFCVDPADPQRAAVVGDLVVTAANGEILTGSYRATVRADFVAGTLVAEGEYAFTGGTGRFEGATGTGSLRVSGSLAPPFEVAGRFTGTIGY